MNKVIITSVIVALMTAMSCRRVENNTDIQTIDAYDIINAPQTPDFSWNQLVKEVKVVPLIAADDNPLPSLSVAGVTNDGMAVLRNSQYGSIYTVDTQSGKVIKSFNHMGRADNEYVRCGPVQVLDNSIYVSDFSGTLKIQNYDFDGNHLRTIANDSLNAFGVQMYDKDKIIAVSDFRKNVGQETPYITVFDTQFNILGEYIPYRIKQITSAIAIQPPMPYGDGYIISLNDLTNNDTIYMYSNGVVQPKVVRTYGDRNIKTEIADKGGYTAHEREISLSISEMYENLIFGRVFSKNSEQYRYFILSNGEVVASRQAHDDDYSNACYGFKCTISNGNNIYMMPEVFGNKLISIFDGYELEGIVDGITADSNPVMIILTLK